MPCQFFFSKYFLQDGRNVGLHQPPRGHHSVRGRPRPQRMPQHIAHFEPAARRPGKSGAPRPASSHTGSLTPLPPPTTLLPLLISLSPCSLRYAAPLLARTRINANYAAEMQNNAAMPKWRFDITEWLIEVLV